MEKRTKEQKGKKGNEEKYRGRELAKRRGATFDSI